MSLGFVRAFAELHGRKLSLQMERAHRELKMTHFTRFFETRHQRTAEGLAAAYGWGYQKVASMDALKQALDGFYQEQGPAILEVCTPPENNDAVLSDYFKTLM